MPLVQRDLAIAPDDLRPAGGCVVPYEPKTGVVLLHGIPWVAPPEPAEVGYGGLASMLAARGFAAMGPNTRGVRRSAGYFSIEGWVGDAEAMLEWLSPALA